MGKECGAWVSRRLWGGSNTSPLKTTAWEATAREATGQIHLPAQAVFEEPPQPLQAANIQTDDKYQAALKSLGQDEYNLVNLVKCLGDFDPVELVGNFVEPSDSINDCVSHDYQDGNT